MFGYVRPLRTQLSEDALRRYEGAYCGLCHCLKRRCGQAARFTLNYDFVFLAMLLEEEDGRPGALCPKPCAAHPFKPRPAVSPSPALELCAQESVILTHYKLLDGAADEGLWKGTGCRLAALALAGAYRRARRACPGFDDHTARCLAQLAGLEGENSPQLDRAADAFARLLAAAAPETGRPETDRPRRELLYHLGRWVYLTDAVDDLAEDLAQGRYNPVAARFGGRPDLEYLATTMTHSLSLAQSAFQLLPATGWTDILANILYLGLPSVQRLVLEGRWNKKSQEKAGEKRP